MRVSSALILGLSAAVSFDTATALPSSCYACDVKYSGAAADDCFTQCGYCSTPDLYAFQAPDAWAAMCQVPPPTPGATLSPHDVIIDTVVDAILNVSQLQGYFFVDEPGGLEENATEAIAYLLDTMPRRDWIQLYSRPFEFMDFLIEHVRYALYAYHTYSAGLGVSWDVFLDAVLPYATLVERRDFSFRWRPRFYSTLMPLVQAANATTVTQAYRAVVAAMSSLQLGGVYGVGPSNQTFAPGLPVTWHSESSPARLSVQDTVQFGASCTGTATTQVMAARSVGLPVRLAGCSESVVRGDDHHWTEFYDPVTSPGPFGTGWHTREGSSAGNADGPWDAPSGPMLGCLQGVIPGSTIDTLWATSWGSTVNLPTLWTNDTRTALWARVGGVNVCGNYCTAWGCGANNTNKWSQQECGPTTD